MECHRLFIIKCVINTTFFRKKISISQCVYELRKKTQKNKISTESCDYCKVYSSWHKVVMETEKLVVPYVNIHISLDEKTGS